MRYDKFSISGDEIVENILGLGTYINWINSDNWNATAADIVEGETAYVLDQKITGILPKYKGKTTINTPTTPTYDFSVITTDKLTLKTAKTYCPEDLIISASIKTWDGTFTGNAEVVS
jgi:hypothetical protein